METVYSMIIDRMQANEGDGLYTVMSVMAQQGLIDAEVVERVWKERNDTIGNTTLLKYLANNGMHDVTPRQWTLDWLKLMHEEEIKRIQSKKKETVYSLLHSAIFRREESFICNALMRMYRDGKVTEADEEMVSKAIKSELGDARTVEEMLGVVYPHTEARAWRLAWLKKMHEKTLEEMQQPEKVEHMKTLSFKEAMYALADGKTLWQVGGNRPAEGFSKGEQYVVGEHPHAEVIRAFGEGKEIEYFSPTSETWCIPKSVNFKRDAKYRVKPEFDFSEGNTILKHDGTMWTITTDTKLHAMTGLGSLEGKPVVFSQNMQNNNGISWDLLENCTKNEEISQVFVAAKNRK